MRELERAAEVLASAPSVALACHVNPDPDALGSMLGLASVLHARGAAVVCSWGNQPLAAPAWIEPLVDPAWIVEAKAFPRAPEVMVCLDTASSDRLGVLSPQLARAGEVIVLDHHKTNPGFGSILVLDPKASSTAELVVRLIEQMGAELTDHAAALLYAGIVTDTGRFQYEATTPETLRVAALLRGRSFDHAKLAQELFEDSSVGYLRLLGVALGRLQLDPAANLVWTYLTQADLSSSGVDITETDALIDVVRTASEADVACVLKQQRDGRFKVSLRSRGATDVGAIAFANGGGGHRLAAGYTSEAGLEDSVEAIVLALTA